MNLEVRALKKGKDMSIIQQQRMEDENIMRAKGQTQTPRTGSAELSQSVQTKTNRAASPGLPVLGEEEMEVNSITYAQVKLQHHQRADSTFGKLWTSP